MLDNVHRIDMMKQQVAIMKCATNWQDTVLSTFKDKGQTNINDLAAIKVAEHKVFYCHSYGQNWEETLKVGGHESERKGAKHPYLQGVKLELVIKIVFYYVLVFSYALTLPKKTYYWIKKFTMCNFRNCLGQIRIKLESSWQSSVIEVKILPMF
jgi:hypothetical protein